MIFRRFLKPTGDLWSTMPPLHWAPPTNAEREVLEQRPGFVAAIVSCRQGHACALRLPPHTISAAGMVNPSLACPVPGCSGHEPAGSTLQGWGQT